MKKIFSLLLCFVIILSALALPACKSPEDAPEDTMNELELVLLSCRNTTNKFAPLIGASMPDLSSGANVALVLDVSKIAGIKLDGNVIIFSEGEAPFTAIKLNEVLISGEQSVSIKDVSAYIAENDVMLSITDVLNGDYYGFKIDEARTSISTLLKKVLPENEVSEIMEVLKNSFSSVSTSAPSVPTAPEFKDSDMSDLYSILKENSTVSSAVAEDGTTTVTITMTLEGAIKTVDSFMAKLSEDATWKKFLDDLDESLKSVAESEYDEATSYWENIKKLLSDELAENDLTLADVIIKETVSINSQGLITLFCSELVIKDDHIVVSEFSAEYGELSSLKLSFKTNKSDVLGIEENSEIELSYAEKASEGKIGFEIKVTANSDAENGLNIENVIVGYEREIASGAYTFKFNSTPASADRESTSFTIGGHLTSSTEKLSASIESISLPSLGISILVDIRAEISPLTDADKVLPEYKDISTLTESDVYEVLGYVNSLFPTDE